MVVIPSPALAVIWHDLECGSYRADLALWRELAVQAATRRRGGARVLDLGAGSGRVALDLARAGHAVTALDSDRTLLAALAERAAAAGLPVETVHADAREFALDARAYHLCVVPMQTLQLLRGRSERGALFERARQHLRPGARLACAIVGDVEAFDSRAGALGPSPERVKHGATLYLSRAISVERGERFITIERERLVLPDADADGTLAPGSEDSVEHDIVELEILTARGLAEELRDAGLEPEPPRTIAETDEHAGSEVAIARA